MLGRDFHGGDVLVAGKELHLLSGREMKHMNALSPLRGELEQAGRGDKRGLRVAPFAVARRVGLTLRGEPRLEPRLILSVEGGPPADLGENARESGLVVDQ